MSELPIAEVVDRDAAEEERKHRFLFSWWHLVLLPLAFVMIVPLIWMLVTSLQTLDQTRHYLSQRQVFGGPLLANQYVSFRLAELGAEVDLLRSYNIACADG